MRLVRVRVGVTVSCPGAAVTRLARVRVGLQLVAQELSWVRIRARSCRDVPPLKV